MNDRDTDYGLPDILSALADISLLYRYKAAADRQSQLGAIFTLPLNYQFHTLEEPMASNNMNHMNHLKTVADHDVQHIQLKEATYQGSWKQRGGIGAFMMLARKWDRLEGFLSDPANTLNQHDADGLPTPDKYDIFEAVATQDYSGADGTVLAEIRDLRRYLLLVEAELLAQREADHRFQQYGVVAGTACVDTTDPEHDERDVHPVELCDECGGNSSDHASGCSRFDPDDTVPPQPVVNTHINRQEILERKPLRGTPKHRKFCGHCNQPLSENTPKRCPNCAGELDEQHVRLEDATCRGPYKWQDTDNQDAADLYRVVEMPACRDVACNLMTK